MLGRVIKGPGGSFQGNVSQDWGHLCTKVFCTVEAIPGAFSAPRWPLSRWLWVRCIAISILAQGTIRRSQGLSLWLQHE